MEGMGKRRDVRAQNKIQRVREKENIMKQNKRKSDANKLESHLTYLKQKIKKKQLRKFLLIIIFNL